MRAACLVLALLVVAPGAPPARAAPPSVATLARSLEHADPLVRRRAVNALAARGSAARAALLGHLARERDAQVLPALLLALAQVGDKEVAPRLTAYVTHPEPVVRGAALTALGELGGPDARRVALHVLADPRGADDTWALRSTALLALARVGTPADLATIRIHYERGGGPSRWLARAAYARVVAALDPEPLAVLAVLIRDPDGRVAVTAAHAMAVSGHPQALLSHLDHATPSVRAAAIGGIQQAGLARAWPRVRRMARWDRSRAVRWTACVVLFEQDDPAADEWVLDAVGADEPAIWTEAVALLAARTGADHGRDVAAWRRALVAARRRPR